jgi:hypothetical protein
VSGTDPVVEVGATVSVKRVNSDRTDTWTIVRSNPVRENGEISADTMVARALLGRTVGDTVPVDSPRPVSYLITRVIPAPSPPTREPAPLPTAKVVSFGAGQDAEYEAWVRQHTNGWVARRADARADGYMLHTAECPHLGLDGSKFTLRTANPRLCCPSRRVLVHRCEAETGSPPRQCMTCT